MNSGVDIVLPVFNEAGNIERALELIRKDVRVPSTVYIVYDFDADSTLPVAKQYADKIGFPIVLVKNTLGRGVLNAMKVGLQQGKHAYKLIMMADLSDPPSVINSMYDMACCEQAAVVCGSRYMKGGSQSGGPWVKSWLSRFAGISAHFLMGIPTKDLTNNFKLYSREFLQSIEIQSHGGFELGMELVLKAHFGGWKVCEVPTDWKDRDSGSSNFRLWAWLPRYIKWYLYGLHRRLFSFL